MNKSKFISILKTPNSINEESIVGLQEVVNAYPYFQSSQLLLTKAFHHTQNLNFEISLKKTAAYAANRKQLHSLLFNNISTDEKETTNDNSKTEDQLLSKDQTPILLEEEASTTNQESSILNLDKEAKIEDNLERQILSSAINSSVLLEVSDEIPEIDHLSFSKEEENEESESHNKIDSFNEEVDHSFSAWIKHFGDDLPDTNEEFDSSQKNDSDSLYIIDSKEKVEFYSATKMAKLSVKEDDDLVTETLANIYADQGGFEKAIKAFKKLQLKYPEKRVYFAGRIKEIQNQLNS